MLKPSSWPRLAKTLVSRSDLEVEYFDQELFNGATVYDVMTRSPRVIVSATDLVRAKPFSFTREQLNGICVDPKSGAGGARGVRVRGDADLFRAAGHAHVRGAMRLPAAGRRERRYARRRRMSTAESVPSACSRSSTAKKFPYLHLADGAFADNLGARAILDEVALGDTVTDALRRNGFSRARRMLFIVVDARTGFDETYAQGPTPIGIKNVMDAVVSATFNRYSFETMNLMRTPREELGDRSAHHALQGGAGDSGLRQVRRGPRRTHVSNASRMPQEREYLDRVPTAFTIVVRADHPAAPRGAPAGRRVAGTARVSRGIREVGEQKRQVGAHRQRYP